MKREKIVRNVMAVAMEGYCFRRMSVVLRLIIAAGGLLLIHPAFMTDVVGLLVVVLCLVYQSVISRTKYA